MKKLFELLFILVSLIAIFSCEKEEDANNADIYWTIWKAESTSDGYRESHILTFNKFTFSQRIVEEYDRNGSGKYILEDDVFITGTFYDEKTRIVLKTDVNEYVSMAPQFINLKAVGDSIIYPKSDGKTLVFKKTANVFRGHFVK